MRVFKSERGWKKRSESEGDVTTEHGQRDVMLLASKMKVRCPFGEQV